MLDAGGDEGGESEPDGAEPGGGDGGAGAGEEAEPVGPGAASEEAGGGGTLPWSRSTSGTSSAVDAGGDFAGPDCVEGSARSASSFT